MTRPSARSDETARRMLHVYSLPRVEPGPAPLRSIAHTAIARDTLSSLRVDSSSSSDRCPALDMCALLHCILGLRCPHAKLVCIPISPQNKYVAIGHLLRGVRNVACPDAALQIKDFCGTSIEAMRSWGHADESMTIRYPHLMTCLRLRQMIHQYRLRHSSANCSFLDPVE
jgi:hypothetical protein